jgi:hypothetical protein
LADLRAHSLVEIASGTRQRADGERLSGCVAEHFAHVHVAVQFLDFDVAIAGALQDCSNPVDVGKGGRSGRSSASAK